MLNRGVYYASRGMYVISTPMDEPIVDKVIEEFEGALEMIKPYAAEINPELITK